jgi:hypothetical protein
MKRHPVSQDLSLPGVSLDYSSECYFECYLPQGEVIRLDGDP